MLGAYSLKVSMTVSPKLLPSLRPSPVLQMIGRILNEDRHNMLSRRRHGRVEGRWNDDVHVRSAGKIAVFGVVVGALDIVHAWADGNRSGEMRSASGKTGEIRQRIQGEIDLRRRAADLKVTRPVGRIRFQDGRESTIFRNVRLGSTPETITLSGEFPLLNRVRRRRLGRS